MHSHQVQQIEEAHRRDGKHSGVRLASREVLRPGTSRPSRMWGVLALVLLGAFATAPAAQAACTPLERLLGCIDPPPPLPPDPGGSSNPAVIPGHLAAGKALGYNNTGLPDAEIPKAVALLRSTGASWLRSGVYWKAEQTRNSDPLLWDRQRLDYAYSHLEGKMMITILGAPYWAQQPCTNLLDFDCMNARSVSRQWEHHSPPGEAYLADYARVARLVAERYPGAIVETWNEPNLGWFWSPDAISPERMAQMQCAAYDAVKLQSAATLVAAPGISPTIGSDLSNTIPKLRYMDWRDYMRRLYVAMGRVCWDVFSVHPYTTSADLDRAGGGLSQFYADLRAMRSQYGDSSRVFLTEIGAPTSGGTSVTEPQQRDLILRQIAKHFEQPEVDGVFIHTLHNSPFNNTDYVNREAHWGVFRFDDSPKPAACAMGILILGMAPDGC